MKSKITLFFIIVAMACLTMGFLNTQNLVADDLTGAWQVRNNSEEHVVLFVDGYFTHTTYGKEDRRFIQTRGGTYSLNNNKLAVHYEFDTRDKEQVGQTTSYDVSLQGNQLSANLNTSEQKWTRIDDGGSGLAGLWKITARKQGDSLQQIHQTGTRKTVKILTSTRFQWAAIDPGTKSFMGTGGGTYTFKDGKYSENIEFFSRDSSRVGSSLTFDGKLQNGDWHHSGLSSKGDPIYEVWSRKK
jgi:hypothetical protein